MKEKISMNDGEGMGSVIRRLRMEREWTQEELAARIRVSSQAVSKWETGQSLPDISQVPTLARTFGVTTDELFGIESLPNDRPELDFSGYDPEKAWEDWQALRDRIEEYEGIDGWIWSYVYVGYQLCCPDTLLYHPDHASEVREETLRYAESRAKRMENSRAWGHSFRDLLMELYALSGNYKKACELGGKAPPFLTSSAMNLVTIAWDMGRWDGAADQLPGVGTAAANHLLGIKDGAIVDIGGGTTGVSILKGGKVVMSDDEASGGTHFSLVIAGSYGMKYDEAELYKRDPKNQKELFPIIRPVIEKIGAIIRGFIGKRKVEQLILVGGSSCIQNIEKEIEGITGISTYKPANPLYVTPIGIALGCAQAAENR